MRRDGTTRAGGDALRGTPWRSLALLLLATLVAGPRPAAGDDDAQAQPAPLDAAAYLALRASKGEARALEALRASDTDPWVVADDLVRRNAGDAALAVAKAHLTSDASALEAYLRRAPTVDAAVVAAREKAEGLLGAGKAEEALAALGDHPVGGLTITEVRLLRVRARALDALDRADEARRVLEKLATRATVIGWRRAAMDAQEALLARLDAEARTDGTQGEGAKKRSAATRRVLSSLLALDADARDLGRSAHWCERLGRLEAARGARRTARRWLLEADSLFGVLARSPGLRPEQTRQRFHTLRALADVQDTMGNTASAIQATFRASDVAQNLGPALRVDALAQVAYVYVVLSRTEEAERTLRQALALATSKEGEPAGEGLRDRAVRLRGDLAAVLVSRGRLEEADKLYEQVRKDLERSPDLRLRFVLRLHLAARWLDRPAASRRVEDLQRALQELLQVRRDLEDAPADFAARENLAANAALLQARTLNLLDRPAEAAPVLRTQLESAYLRDIPDLTRYAQRELAHALRRTGHVQEAYDISEEAVRSLGEGVGRLSASYALSRLSQPDVAELVDEHVACALALGSAQQVVAALERTRGMAFLAELRRRQRQGSGGGVNAHGTGVSGLAAEVAQAAAAYWTSVGRNDWAAQHAARQALWDRRLQLRAAREREDLEEAHAAPGAPASGHGPAFRPPPALLDDEAMLYYAAAGAQEIAALVRGGRARVFDLGPRAALEARLGTQREAWLEDDPKAIAAAQSDLLHAVLPQALRVALTTSAPKPLGHVYVSAGGVPGRLPWPVLVAQVFRGVAGSAKGGPTVSLVASQEVLRRLKLWNRPAQAGPVLALGDPEYATGPAGRTRVAIFGRPLRRLKQSAAEVDAITDAARGDLVLKGEDACEPMLRRCLFDAPYPFEVLHLSCHGILYASAPWLSALALHPTPGEDGLLTVDEVSRWRLPQGPHLVVLAACETGLGVPIPGEGEEGLVRSFLLAGARHVVASLWEVPDDSSRRIMVAFHEHRRAGVLAPARALRLAQEDVRAQGKDGRPLVPRQWAGWAVWGPRD
jgi:tetratricopeptide (TPR) repeat protein